MAAQSTASVTRLPTAAQEPVKQPARRGRYPKSIARIHDWRMEIMKADHKRHEIRSKIEETQGALSHILRCTNALSHELDVLKQQERQLCRKA